MKITVNLWIYMKLRNASDMMVSQDLISGSILLYISEMLYFRTLSYFINFWFPKKFCIRHAHLWNVRRIFRTLNVSEYINIYTYQNFWHFWYLSFYVKINISFYYNVIITLQIYTYTQIHTHQLLYLYIHIDIHLS